MKKVGLLLGVVTFLWVLLTVACSGSGGLVAGNMAERLGWCALDCVTREVPKVVTALRDASVVTDATAEE